MSAWGVESGIGLGERESAREGTMAGQISGCSTLLFLFHFSHEGGRSGIVWSGNEDREDLDIRHLDIDICCLASSSV